MEGSDQLRMDNGKWTTENDQKKGFAVPLQLCGFPGKRILMQSPPRAHKPFGQSQIFAAISF